MAHTLKGNTSMIILIFIYYLAQQSHHGELRHALWRRQDLGPGPLRRDADDQGDPGLGRLDVGQEVVHVVQLVIAVETERKR